MRTPQNIEMQRGFKTGDAQDFVSRTVAIGSIPDGAQNPLWSAKEVTGTWIFCKWPCCAVMRLQSGGQTQVEDVFEVQACLVGPTFCVDGEYGRDGNSNRFIQYLPQWEYGKRDTAHFAPGDTVEFKDVSNAEFYFASITDYNLNDGPGGQPRAEACPLTVAARKADGCPWSCLVNITYCVNR